MIRWIFNLWVALCLLLATAIALLWARSYTHHLDELGWNSELGKNYHQSGFCFESRPGHLTFWYEISDGLDSVSNPGRFYFFQAVDPTQPSMPEESKEKPGLFGVAWAHYDDAIPPAGDYVGGSPPVANSPYRQWVFSCSYWLLMLAVLTALMVGIFRHRRSIRRRRLGRICLHCGYDLRASPDRCPECGRAAFARNPV